MDTTKSKQYTIGIDIGTTAVKAVLLDAAGEALAWARHDQQQFYPQPGWVEQDPEELLAFLSENGHPVLGMEPFDM